MSIHDPKPVDVPSLFLLSTVWLYATGHPIAGTAQLLMFIASLLA